MPPASKDEGQLHTPPSPRISPEENQDPGPDPSKPIIALTFDDGPHPQYTDMILTALEENGAKGTFFIIGPKINDCLPQIKRILENGHQLGNHTWGHLDLTTLNPEGVKRQIMSVYDSVNGLFSQGPLLVRPPYGFFDPMVSQSAGFPLIHWSVDTLDWETLDADKVTAHVLDNAKDGDIILMHDIYPSTAEAVIKLLPLLSQRGFQMATVSEMFSAKGFGLEPGRAYFSAR